MSYTLLAVIDPTEESQPALKRAERLAIDSGAGIHAFCCDYADDITDFSSRKDAKYQTLQNSNALLKRLVTPLLRESIRVTTEAYWNQNWEKSVIEACTRNGVDLMVKTISPHSNLVRQLTHTSDYALLRYARCPILLTHDGAPWQNRRILAAISLDRLDNEHERLNLDIISAAQKLARVTGSELHIVSALEKSPDLSEIFKIIEDQDDVESDAERIGLLYGVNPDRVHLHSGNAADVICNAANDINADVVVLGTIARKNIQALMLGNTAEKVLDKLDIDMLVVN